MILFKTYWSHCGYLIKLLILKGTKKGIPICLMMICFS